MHRVIVRLTVVAVFVALTLTAPTLAAHADSWGDVDCTITPTDSHCTVTVNYVGDGSTSSGDGDDLVCKIGDVVVECYHEGFGWLGSDGCYYGKDPGGFLPPNEWIKSCYNPATGAFDPAGTVLLFDPPLALGVITDHAVDHLSMPKPTIAANPNLAATQFVHVPVWWWVRPGWWQTQTASASAGGLTITAKAVPQKITWYAGDGTSTVCTGPGTPWTPSTDPNSASPDCGHTYAQTSAKSPGGTFTLRAVATWDISWSGGGYSGAEPAITTTTTATVIVRELRAVVTG